MRASLRAYTEVLKLLIRNGANVDGKNISGRTALMLASEYGHTKVVRLLLDAEADVNVIEPWGHTAPMLARYKGHTEIVKLLKNVEIKRQTKKHWRRQRDRKNLHKQLKSRWGGKYSDLQTHMTGYLFN